MGPSISSRIEFRLRSSVVPLGIGISSPMRRLSQSAGVRNSFALQQRRSRTKSVKDVTRKEHAMLVARAPW